MKATVTVSEDFTDNFKKIIDRFKNDRVLVGIPEEKNARSDETAEEQINNAQLLAIANFGSPARNIPPWPIMAIGIRNARSEIAKQFEKLAQLTLHEGSSAFDTYYNRIGILASQSVKQVINTQTEVPDNKPSEATLAARRRRKPTPFKGTKYWLVTGQMRNAITWVIGGRK